MTTRHEKDTGKPLRVMYIHGFGSRFSPNSDKCVALAAHFDLVGESYDYTLPFRPLEAWLAIRLGRWQPDVLIGTSLGGFWAAWLGSRSGRPFLALNPVVRPAQSLRKWIGRGTDHHGQPYTLTEDALTDYPEFPLEGGGQVLIETGDKVIDPFAIDTIGTAIPVTRFEGGNHRFSRTALLPEWLRHVAE